MIYIDTSVLVGASTPSDARQRPCLAALQEADRKGGACSAHSLAEFYSVMSGRPRPLKVPPFPAAQMIEAIRRRYKIVSLTPSEYLGAVDDAARAGESGGAVFDCLHLACARKINATRILTLDAADFRRLAPDLASIVVEP